MAGFAGADERSIKIGMVSPEIEEIIGYTVTGAERLAGNTCENSAYSVPQYSGASHI